ncbi:response regulator, partial [candidate division GN15 bacterium]|nr:response regulator [candidate division GN15 bacterium]
MASKLTILFVDDQPNILEGLRRSMRKMRNEWDMTFVTSGREALAEMDERPFDVIVTDMMMPEMTGVEVLKTVAARYPETVRYVLSGHSDREMILQSTGFAHRYLAKPCDPDELKQLLNNSLGLRETLARSDLHRRISSIGSLPS